MVREVASKTSDVAGDGTTTATVLLKPFIAKASRLFAAGAKSDGHEARHREGCRPWSAALRILKPANAAKASLIGSPSPSPANDCAGWHDLGE